MIIPPERQAAAELGRHLANGWKRKPAQVRIAEATKNLDPTAAYLQSRRIVVDALREGEEQPSTYSRNARRILRQRLRQKWNRRRR
jgi:hypothetical protein